jgi:hypothetical protein
VRRKKGETEGRSLKLGLAEQSKGVGNHLTTNPSSKESPDEALEKPRKLKKDSKSGGNKASHWIYI